MGIRSDFGAWLIGVAAAVGCAGPRPAVVPAAKPEREVWVDGSAHGPFDGTALRPLRRLDDALRSGVARIHLRTGIYLGPFSLRDVALVGQGTVVLSGGLEARGEVALTHLTVQGARAEVAVRVEAGRLVAEDVHFEASISETRGVALAEGARAELEDCAFAGPFRRGVELAPGSSARMSKTRFADAVTAVHATKALVALRSVAAAGGRGPAVFVSGGALEAEGLEVEGGEYALLARDGARIRVRHLISSRAERAVLGLFGATGELAEVTVRETKGSFAECAGDSQVSLSSFRTDAELAAPPCVRLSP